MKNVVLIPASSPSPSTTSQPPRRPGPGAILTLVNGVLAGVGGIYASTHSALITVIAALAGTAAMVLIFRRSAGPSPAGALIRGLVERKIW